MDKVTLYFRPQYWPHRAEFLKVIRDNGLFTKCRAYLRKGKTHTEFLITTENRSAEYAARGIFALGVYFQKMGYKDVYEK